VAVTQAVRKLRVGVDVGGTFTDVVAIDAATRALVASVKVPTTHRAPHGVAEGISTGIARLLARAEVPAHEVTFIAHSTTQATNALLEGDVARVGIVGLIGGPNPFARAQMRIPSFDLAAGARFSPQIAFARAGDAAEVRGAVDALIAQGAEAIAVTRAFGVDRPEEETRVVDIARDRGLFATSGHDVSATYGLRARTRTAALNAAILPRMVETARTTANAVEHAAILAPLMVMRSDGGVMDVHEIERRPIHTLLSGPAAGVAGALLYEQVSDGIFIEVGGTSADCSAIRAGRPQMRAARIGGRRMMLRTLDVRTLGIAGGSMLRVDERRVVDVGPRSAHIADCEYASFVEPERMEGARIERIAPTPRDPADYAVIVDRDDKRIALTPTCASNLLGYVPEGAFARGSAESSRRGFELLARDLGGDADSLARSVLEIGARKLAACIEELIFDYALDPAMIVLVGGGGGAAALVPFVAEQLKLPHRIAKDAEVLSPIGVALALVRDSIERTIVDPTPAEIARLRREASDRVIAAGAAPERVEVSIEIDAQRNRVRATASGATALVEGAAAEAASQDAIEAVAARSLRAEASALQRVALTPSLTAYGSGRDLRVLDERGVIRLALRDSAVVRTQCGDLEKRLRIAIEDATSFGDVGRALPELYVIHGARIADFSGLASAEQAVALAREEIGGREESEPVAILTVPRAA
jgi:N-methylhydantoinase A/oxoprolinase/acetone carboxylase beta subunit